METAPTGGCPFHTPQALPDDSTPLRPSPTFADWREAGPAVPLAYDDGHVGLVVTRYDAARAILGDPRFSQVPHRMPVSADHPRRTPAPVPQHGEHSEHGEHGEHEATASAWDTLDDDARASIAAANLLALDGAAHQRMRRAITPRFSVKQARGREPWVHDLVAGQLRLLQDAIDRDGQADLFTGYALPISAATHCQVIGVPDDLLPRFRSLFEHPSAAQRQFAFIREVVDRRIAEDGAERDDVLADLLASDLSRIEVEGLLFQLMSAGRDSVAYLIATAMTALLTHPEQAATLRADPARVAPAVEEFMRTGAMFLTLFPRTATEDVDIEGVHVAAGQTVSVSPVGANRDPRQFDRPEAFDVDRDAFGHLGFGHGPHGCVGQQVARLEIRQAVTQLLLGMPDLRLVDAEQLRPMPFANPVATYEAGAVVVARDPASRAARRAATAAAPDDATSDAPADARDDATSDSSTVLT